MDNITHKKIQDLPYPNSWNILFGNLLQLRDERIDFLLKNREELGDIYQIRVPTRKVMVLSDPDWVKYVLVDNNKNYIKSFAYDSIKMFLGNGLLTSEGEFWKRQRRLAQPAFHKEKLALMFKNMLEQTRQSVDEMKPYAASGQLFNLNKVLYKLTLNVVNNTLFYNEVDNTTDRIYHLVSKASEIISQRIDSLVQLPEWIPTQRNLHQKQIIAEMDALFYDVIERRRKTKVDFEDLLSMLMDAVDEETGETMSNKQLRDEILTIFVAGHETTQIALAWTFYLLGQNPEKKAILQREIDEQLKGELPTPENIRGLHYLKKVIDESMRCFPPAWIMGRRNVATDHINGYEIEPGTNIIMPIYVIHHREDIWEKPFEFIPERFETAALKEKHKYAYFPFGGGPRLCIGNNFALQEMQIVMILFMQHFDFQIDEQFIPDMEALVTLRQKNALYARIRRKD